MYLVGLWDITVRRLNLENMYNVSKIVIYQSYVRNKRDHNDIALIRLNRPAKLGKNVQPICLPPTVKIHILINCISPPFFFRQFYIKNLVFLKNTLDACMCKKGFWHIKLTMP